MTSLDYSRKTRRVARPWVTDWLYPFLIAVAVVCGFFALAIFTPNP